MDTPNDLPSDLIKHPESSATADGYIPDPGVEFMLHELDNVRSFLQEDTNIDERRMDVLMLLISGVGAGLGLLAQAGVDHTTLLDILLVACAILPLVTLPVFIDTIERDISAVDYIRAVNSIRQYFIMRAPAIQSYLLMPGSGPYPRYGGVSSNRRMLALITSAALALLPMLARVLLYHETHVDPVTVEVTLAAFALSIVVHWRYWNLQYRKATREAKEYQSTALARIAKNRERLDKRKQRRWPWRRRPTSARP